MAGDPSALEQHHCNVGANFVRLVLPSDVLRRKCDAYRKIDSITDYTDNTDGSRRNAAHETHEARQ
jgi:hypothetical protein